MGTKKKFYESSEVIEINKYRNMYRRLCSGEHVLLGVDLSASEEFNYYDVFGKYLNVFRIFMDRGLLVVKRLDEITEEDFEILD